MTVKSISAEALRGHMLDNNKVSILDAALLFGVQNLSAELTRIKSDGFLIKNQRVPMSKILRRLNEYAVVTPPSKLPVREILMTEYWISR